MKEDDIAAVREALKKNRAALIQPLREQVLEADEEVTIERQTLLDLLEVAEAALSLLDVYDALYKEKP